MAAVIRPSSEHEGIALLLAVIFCFVLGLLGIYFACTGRYIPMIVSIIASAFFVLMVFGLKSLLWWMRLRRQQ